MGQASPLGGRVDHGLAPSGAWPPESDLQLQDFFENGGIALD